jgi:hypothetical protein
VDKLVKKRKVVKIITIDAATKLEGERTGLVAEGVGVAVGGIGVDKSYIENIAVTKNIPLDSIVIKLSAEEAIQPMKPAILASRKKVLKVVERAVKKTKGRGDIVIVGVGNSTGIGNNGKEAEESEKLIRGVIKKLKQREMRRRKKTWLDLFRV